MAEKKEDSSTDDLREKQVEKRLTRKERIEELKTHIREIGLWNLPPQRTLAEKYGVTHQQINKDIKKIISTFDPKALHEVFTECFEADKKIMRELRKIILQGSYDDQIKAGLAYLQIQRGITDLLEAWSKKQKVPDKIEHQIKQVVINIVKPEEEIYEIKSPKKNESKNKN